MTVGAKAIRMKIHSVGIFSIKGTAYNTNAQPRPTAPVKAPIKARFREAIMRE